MKKTLGIIGSGNHFKKRMYPIFRKSNFFKISGMLRRKPIKFNNIRNYKDVEFFKKKFDFVYICCPNNLHEKYILKSLMSGSHVICEKPFITRKKNLNKIINLAKKNDKLIFETFMYCYHPVFNYLKKLIKSNKFGKVRYVISNFRYPSLNKDNNRYILKEGNGFYNDAASYVTSLETYLFENKQPISKYFSQKIANKVDLRGNIFIKYSNSTRHYFWGEGQNYTNNIEIFFDRATIHIDKFFSKATNEQIKLKIFSKKLNEKVFKKTNQFVEMINHISKNYNRKKFKKLNIELIKNHTNLFTKLKNK